MRGEGRVGVGQHEVTARVTRQRFNAVGDTIHEDAGGALWIGSVTVACYVFGNIPWVKDSLDKIIWGAILIPGLFVIIGAWRAQWKRRARPT